MRRSDQGHGDLYVDDNMTNATSWVYTPLIPVGPRKIVTLTHDTIGTDGVIGMVPNGLKGLEINPNLNQNQTYRIVSNTATTITVDVSGKSALTSIASIGDTYRAVYRFDNVYFRRGGFLVAGDSLMVNGTMRIDEYGQLTHYDATLNYETLLDLTVGTLEITSTGSINVDGRGYLGGKGGGNGCRGRTVGNADGSTYRSGGSYGGLVGSYSGGIPNSVYGSLTDPEGLGSGGSCGGNNDNAGGDGGGWVEINATQVMVDGVITANGTNGTGVQAGSGSGGTIYITTSTLSGAGAIRANGGGYEVGGGGGRVAVNYDTSTFTGQATASGGDGNYADGQNGSVLLE